MKRLNHKWIIPFLFFALTILVSCIPVATGEPSQEPPVPSSITTQTGLPIILETAQPTLTITSTGSPTASQTVQLTQTFIPIVSPIVSKPPRPTRTFTPTASPTITETVQPTGTAEPSATYCPQATAEPFSVDPVTSPTDQLSQVINVHIGNGEWVKIITESGTFTATDNTHLVEISLVPNTVHHLEVIAKVRKVPAWNGCIYGGYTLSTRVDGQGNPLTIVQGEPIPQQAKSIITVDNAWRLKELASFAADTGFAADFVFSKNNEVISVGNKISIWSTVTGKEVRQIGNTPAEASSVAINSDGSLIAVGGVAAEAAGDDNVQPWNAPKSVQLWDTATGEMNELGFDQSYPSSMAFNPNGNRLAAGSREDSVTVWDVNNQEILITFKGDVSGRLQTFSNLYWMDDHTLVAGGSEAIYWWDTTTGSLLQRLAKPAEANFFVDVAFSQNGDRVAGAAQDAYVYFWDRAIETWSRWPASPDSRITVVRFSPDGQLLAGGTDKGQMLIWNVEARQLLAQYSMINGYIIAIRFSPDGRYIAIGGGQGPIRLWGIP